jgi:hypothetical protein
MVIMDRRQALRVGVLGLTLLGTSTGVAQLAAARPVPLSVGELTEIYLGRRIRIRPDLPVPRVFIDDVELHVMLLDTGAYTTQLNHYQTFSTPLLAARAAVEGLRGARLLPFHR